MATSTSYIHYIMDCYRGSSLISNKKMFGEYGIYFQGKIIALVCDDRFLFKYHPDLEEKLEGKVTLEAPYPKAKNALRVDDQVLEDYEFLMQVSELAYSLFPQAKKKK